MARDYAKTNFLLWQDEDWRALPFPAQHLYKMLWEHPHLSYCGVVEWKPMRLLGWGQGWTRDLAQAAIECLLARHFIVLDENTEECLIRSWVRFDGVLKQPRLSVSLVKAYTAVGSNTLRGVVVDELHKLHDREPDLAGWEKTQVQEILTGSRVSAKSLEVPADPFPGGAVVMMAPVQEDVSASVTPLVSVPLSPVVSLPVSEALGGNATSGFGSGLGTAYNSNSNLSTATASSTYGGGSSQPARPETAQTLMSEWIDRCGSEKPPGRIKGQVAKELKTLLDEGYDFELVRRALAAWHQKNLNPGLLPSVLHEVQRGGRQPGAVDRGSKCVICQKFADEHTQADDHAHEGPDDWMRSRPS